MTGLWYRRGASVGIFKFLDVRPAFDPLLILKDA
jgi:hypothetical protein